MRFTFIVVFTSHSTTPFLSSISVRYSRLSSIRRQLGYQGPGPDWVDADKISLDKNYLAVDLVINWAADGLVLCFIHAVVDLNSIADNDEVHKTDWTNWCGTPWMPPEQTETLHNRFLMCVPQTGTMSRVFQILLNERERPLLLSWPPDSTQGPHSGDFAKLVENVQISAGVPGESDAKTSCTRRYKALQDMPAVLGYQVESIFIPHGKLPLTPFPLPCFPYKRYHTRDHYFCLPQGKLHPSSHLNCDESSGLCPLRALLRPTSAVQYVSFTCSRRRLQQWLPEQCIFSTPLAVRFVFKYICDPPKK